MKVENSSVQTRKVTFESQEELKEAIKEVLIARGHVTNPNTDTIDIDFVHDAVSGEVDGAIAIIEHVTDTGSAGT